MYVVYYKLQSIIKYLWVVFQFNFKEKNFLICYIYHIFSYYSLLHLFSYYSFRFLNIYVDILYPRCVCPSNRVYTYQLHSYDC